MYFQVVKSSAGPAVFVPLKFETQLRSFNEDLQFSLQGLPNRNCALKETEMMHKRSMINDPQTSNVKKKPPWLTGFVPNSGKVGYLVDKVELEQAFLSTLVSPAN